jgi:hypothetical protein
MALNTFRIGACSFEVFSDARLEHPKVFQPIH